jgi:hypothetical protein
LSERYGVEPNLETGALIEALAARDPALDARALRDLMNALSQSQVSEQELVKIAAQLDAFLRQLRG